MSSLEKTNDSGPDPAAMPSSIDLLKDVEVEVTLEIGRRRIRIADVLKLTRGQTLELS